MTLVECQKCRESVPKETEECPHCGCNLHIICPNCGLEQANTEECRGCGLIIKKYKSKPRISTHKKKQSSSPSRGRSAFHYLLIALVSIVSILNFIISGMVGLLQCWTFFGTWYLIISYSNKRNIPSFIKYLSAVFFSLITYMVVFDLTLPYSPRYGEFVAWQQAHSDYRPDLSASKAKKNYGSTTNVHTNVSEKKRNISELSSNNSPQDNIDRSYLSNHSCPYPVRKTYYKNGNIKEEICFVNGIREGISREYYENGSLKYFKFYDNGKMTNGSRKHYEAGGIETEYSFDDGKLNGLVKDYYETGELKFLSHYVDNKLNGLALEFYRNGTIKGEKYYVDGELRQKED